MARKKRSTSKRRTRKKSVKSSAVGFLARTHSAVRGHLSAATDLPTFLGNAGELTLANRKRLVDQALVLIESNYVHLPLKEAMHGVDPVQRLRLVKHRLEQSTSATMGSEHAFHREMLDIFNSVRDLHTNYVLPAPFANTVAFLPFDIEEYFENGQARYIATHFVQGFSHAHFKPGVEVTLWSGVPIARAIDVIANRHAGSNQAARHARGIEGLTIRALARALPPDELWVDVGYKDLNGQQREMRQEWLVNPPLPDTDGVAVDAATSEAASQGVDLESDIIRRMKAMLYAPQVVASMKKKRRRMPKQKALLGESVETTMQGVFAARSVDTPAGEFGYVRIFTFSTSEPGAFVDEFARILGLLPQRGLIIDVRGNGGGHIWASEGLLQLLTPIEVQPEPTQFINTPLNLRICERHDGNPQIDLGPWVESMRASLETGAVYSRGFPITPAEFANERGQHYHGPVVLITDARCYSATDIFAAGFKDHDIGAILGTDDNTGAGGANVWTHGLLRQLLRVPTPIDADSPYDTLPNGAGLRVSIRRTLRVGEQSGTPVEDLGITPDERYRMTRNDLLNSNEDLIGRAAELLASQPVRALDVEIAETTQLLKLSVTTLGLDGLDLYIDGRPVESHTIANGTHDIEIEHPGGGAMVELAGYNEDAYVAARKLTL